MKAFKIILGILGSIIMVFLIGLFIYLKVLSPESTPPFIDENGTELENSIATMEYVELGGARQFILVRGKNVENPVLLMLHGGPGSTELPMWRRFNSPLEDYYTVVYWDQRGSGKSFDKDIPVESLTIDQLVEDTHELTTLLKQKLHKEKIFLFGHSWGSMLGMITAGRYPEDYYAFVGAGQIGDQPRSDSLSYCFVLDKAEEQNDTAALAKLVSIGSYTDENLEKTGFMQWLAVQRSYLSGFGGSVADVSQSTAIFAEPLLHCREYSIGDKYRFLKGNTPAAFISNCYSKMVPAVLKTDLTEVSELQIPVFIVQGVHDYTTNYDVAREYFDLLKAPVKEFVSFDNSGHFPHLEEADRFNLFMTERVLQEATAKETGELKTGE
jgi:pimeloyl-ACP methyl ester carboxylesterase